MSDKNIIIETKGVKKYFSSRVSGKIKALDGVSAKIHKGEVVVIVGPSGSGKSTFLRCLNLLEIPVEGDTILVPSFRPDLNLMADVAEEVGRSYGYNEIPTTAFRTSTQGGYSQEM